VEECCSGKVFLFIYFIVCGSNRLCCSVPYISNWIGLKHCRVQLCRSRVIETFKAKDGVTRSICVVIAKHRSVCQSTLIKIHPTTSPTPPHSSHVCSNRTTPLTLYQQRRPSPTPASQQPTPSSSHQRLSRHPNGQGRLRPPKAPRTHSPPAAAAPRTPDPWPGRRL